MRIKDLFEKWGLRGLKINAGFAEFEFSPQDPDRDAAWELYVELLTRVTTQALPKDQGTEKAALNSIHSLFKTTRDVLKCHGRDCIQFSKVAVIVLNQVLRPFTTKWHEPIEKGELNTERQEQFRSELTQLQSKLLAYTHILAEIAAVEDLSDLENA